MKKKGILVALTTVLLLFIGIPNARSQSPGADGHRFEVGGQLAILNDSVVGEISATIFPCINPPCPTAVRFFSKSRKIQPGFGGRLGYNLTDDLALEAEFNFFPKADLFTQPEDFNNGTLIEGLFGLKAGKRFEKVGIFGKARPGFLYASKGDLQEPPGTVCGATDPPGAGCFQTISRNSFAFDLGGVVEVYPTKRTLIRFDVGDTIVRLNKRRIAALIAAPFGAFGPSVITVPAETTHNFQVSIGIGYRF